MSKAPRLGILRFLGTNCDYDVWKAVEAAGFSPEWLWHQDHFTPESYCGFILPGGFSYGDYLRSGALAARSPAMVSLAAAAQKGFPVLGICNGFQILCEAQLLPGVLVRNQKLRFIDQWVKLEIQSPSPHWASSASVGEHFLLPIAHGDGRYFVEPPELERLQDNGQVWFSYVGDNPNGSVGAVAGVMNATRNVAGLMPHPERAVAQWMGGADGQPFFRSLLEKEILR